MLRREKLQAVRMKWARNDRERRAELASILQNIRHQGHLAYLGRDRATHADAVMVACNQGCGAFHQLLGGIPMASTCQKCYLEGKEQASV